MHLLHIPKTGGITFHRALQAAGVDVSRSHDPAQVPTDALVVTLLRHPIDRAWSVYRYHVRQGWFDGTLAAFLQRDPPDVWWWGMHNVQSRYMRPGVLVGITERLGDLVRLVCGLVGVTPPAEYDWHGRDTGDGYSPAEYAQLAAAVGQDDMALYSIVGRTW